MCIFIITHTDVTVMNLAGQILTLLHSLILQVKNYLKKSFLLIKTSELRNHARKISAKSASNEMVMEEGTALVSTAEAAALSAHIWLQHVSQQEVGRAPGSWGCRVSSHSPAPLMTFDRYFIPSKLPHLKA